MKNIPMLKLENINKQEEKDINGCDVILNNGEIGNNRGDLDSWENVRELPLINDYEHRYFLVWNYGQSKANLRRVKKQ